MIAKKDNIHLLVIRLSAMGDVAMLVPVLLALHQAIIQMYRVTVLTKPHFKPIFYRFTLCKCIRTADVKGKHKGILGLFELFRELVQLNIDAVADTHNVLRSRVLTCIYSNLNRIKIATLSTKGVKRKRQLTSLES